MRLEIRFYWYVMFQHARNSKKPPESERNAFRGLREAWS